MRRVRNCRASGRAGRARSDTSSRRVRQVWIARTCLVEALRDPAAFSGVNEIAELSSGFRPRAPPCLGCGLEASWMPVGVYWEAFGGPLGGSLDASWGSFWGLLGCLGNLLGASGSRSWALLGAVLTLSWAVLGASWAVWGPSWAVWRPSWAVLGASWGVSSAVLERYWGLLGRSWSVEKPKR